MKLSPVCRNAPPTSYSGRRSVPPARLTYKGSSFSQSESDCVQCAKSLELERTVKLLKAQVSKLETTVARMEFSLNMASVLLQTRDDDQTWTPFSCGQPSSMDCMDALLLQPTSVTSTQLYLPNSLESLNVSGCAYRHPDLFPIKLNFEDGKLNSLQNCKSSPTTDL
nr:MAG: hypothetical protein [Skomarfal virus 49]